jgi:uncharacterized protein (TIGR00369 family)
MSIEPQFAHIAETLESGFGDHPVRRFLAFTIDALSEGQCTLSIRFEPEFDNTTGAVHGGILSMLADTAAACALATCFDGEMNFATSNLNIHFLRRASTAGTATATVIKKGARVSVVSAELHDSDRRQVATALCDFVLLTQREPAPAEEA